MAIAEYLRWPPGFPLARARQASSAEVESQTVRSPRFLRLASYSAQFRTRYCDFAYLYWLLFGYFFGGGSRVVGFASLGSYTHEPCTNAVGTVQEDRFLSPVWSTERSLLSHVLEDGRGDTRIDIFEIRLGL